MSSSIIHLLPDHVANQIAAGEVVQRPASVVKELLENSVDAGATSIKLLIKDAGKTLIQVIDNGKGMNEIDARMCFERHATSKISMAEDLFNLQTKGFRGEALASIAAIAHVELKTKTEDAELGTHILMEGSQLVSQNVIVTPKGTSFLVKNLFYNIPARRKFLKSDQVELKHIVDEFERVCLAHPQIAFSLINNGSEMFVLPASNLRQRIVNVFGNKIADKLVPVEETTEILSISGFIAKPEYAKKTRGEQFFFVNDRFVKSSYLHHAVSSAFEGLLKEGVHPSYFLYLTLPPQSIDINIHPTKTEVKFDDEQALYAILRATVKHSLGQFQVVPSLDFQADMSLEVPYKLNGTESVTPTISVDANFNPFHDEPSETFQSKVLGNSHFEKSAKDFGKTSPSNTVFNSRNHVSPKWETLYAELPNNTDKILSANHLIEQDFQSVVMFENQHQDVVQSKSFQIHKKYIVCPIKTGMVVIEQRRAHQRILYENYLNRFNQNYNPSQQLLFPIRLYYSAYELEMLSQLQDYLEKIGINITEFSEDKIVVSGIPVGMNESEVSMVIDDLLSDWQSDIPKEEEHIRDRMAKSFAQSLAVKTGTILSEKEQEDLMNRLFACKTPNISPFQKPTYITMSLEELDKKFMI